MAKKKYRVYAIDNINNCEALLLVDGVYVINGAYECKKHRDGTLGIPHSPRRAYFVMDAPIPGNDYNKVLEEARRIMKETPGDGPCSSQQSSSDLPASSSEL